MTLMSGPLEMDLVGIGLILVLGVILGADANDAYVIPLDLSPPTFWRDGRVVMQRTANAQNP